MAYTLIRNGTLIDGTGARPLPGAAVLIEDDHIIETGVEGDVRMPSGDVTTMDAGGGWILPGFIDAHVHMMFETYDIKAMLSTPFAYRFYQAIPWLRRTLDAGITTVRDAGGMDYGVKKALEDGIVSGPRAKISVTALSVTGGHGDGWMPSGVVLDPGAYPGMPEAVCDGVPEVRQRVRQVLRAGAEVIKISSTGGVLSPTDRPEYTQFSPEELAAIVQEAAFHGGKKVMAHAQGSEGIRQALLAGIHSIEHGIFLTDEIIDLMLKNGTFLVPTLFAPVSIVEDPAYKEKLPPALFRKAEEVVDIHRENIAKAHKAGVKIALGTDSGVMVHGRNLRELELLCGIGMSPLEAITAGTKTAAECLEWEDTLGTVEKGKLADLVISSVDPLADIAGLQDAGNIRMVIKNGVIEKDMQ